MSLPVGQTLSLASRRHDRATAVPYLFLILEADRPRASSVRYCLAEYHEVVLGRGAERRTLPSGGNAAHGLLIEVPDRRMSRVHAKLSRVLSGWVLADSGSKNGTLVNDVLVATRPLVDGDIIQLGQTIFLFRMSLPADPYLSAVAVEASTLQPRASGLATLHPALAAEMRKLEQVSGSCMSILLAGESGTGKEVVARAVHAMSRRPGPFIAVNCGAIATNLVESELFGHRKGAFSGALEDRPGLVRSADRGTLFLDEIGDLPLTSQAALLRVLQEKEVVPVGGVTPLPVDFRLVSATHRPLASLVSDGRFRADLLARISGFVFALLPLRDRREDLGLLVTTLLDRLAPAARDRVTFDVETLAALVRYQWPANIRELEKCLHTAALLAGEKPIELAHLPTALSCPAPGRPGCTDEPTTASLSEEDTRLKERLQSLLREHAGNIAAVASSMGKARMQVHRWMKRFGMDAKTFRS